MEITSVLINKSPRRKSGQELGRRSGCINFLCAYLLCYNAY